MSLSRFFQFPVSFLSVSFNTCTAELILVTRTAKTGPLGAPPPCDDLRYFPGPFSILSFGFQHSTEG